MTRTGWRASCPPFFLLLLQLTAVAHGQTIRVYSEFQRIDPFGNVIQADRGTARSREVLSPALLRNASSSFHIAVQAPQGVPYWLYIGLNPESMIDVTLYKEVFEQQKSGEWVPDKLVKLDLPYNGLVPEKHIPGQSVEVFLLDVHVPKNSEVQRMKIEPQMWIPDRWITYPMEARIVPAQLLTQVPKLGEIHPIESPADFTYRDVFHRVTCGARENNPPSEALSIRSLIQRNAQQDAALAARLLGNAETGALLDYTTQGDWCKSPIVPRPAGPERSLRLRDRLLREKKNP